MSNSRTEGTRDPTQTVWADFAVSIPVNSAHTFWRKPQLRLPDRELLAGRRQRRCLARLPQRPCLQQIERRISLIEVGVDEPDLVLGILAHRVLNGDLHARVLRPLLQLTLIARALLLDRLFAGFARLA